MLQRSRTKLSNGATAVFAPVSSKNEQEAHDPGPVTRARTSSVISLDAARWGYMSPNCAFLAQRSFEHTGNFMHAASASLYGC